MPYLRKGAQNGARKKKKMKKNGILKISRGYRLKLSTHKLIKSLQDITEASSDTVLNRSCMLYYKTILEQNEKSIINNKLNNNGNVE